jgi:hypothetical protein
MSDDKTITPEELEQHKAEIEKLKSDLEFQKSESRKAFEKRDELKRQVDEAERVRLEKENEFKALYEKTKNDLETYKVEKENELNEVKPYKEKWTSYETLRKETLLGQITDIDIKTIGSKMELSDLEVFVSKQTNRLPGDDGRSGKTKLNYEGKKWNDLSSDDKDTLHKENPDKYKQLLRERFN